MVELDTNLDGTRDYRLWPTFDANFNVTGLLTDQGVTVERYAYTPYGERIILNGDQNYANSGADPDGAEWTVDTNGSDFAMLLGLQGKRQEAETGGWFFIGRYQNPAAGVFQQRDPLLHIYQDGMHLTEFEQGNPLINTDPLGLFIVAAPAAAPVAAPAVPVIIVAGGAVIVGTAIGEAIGPTIVPMDPPGPRQPPITDAELAKALARQKALREAAQRQADYEAYKKRCNEQLPPNLTDPCEVAKWKL